MGKHIIFLHGLHSSPRSQKCHALSAYLENHHPDISLLAPQLSYDPDQNWQQLQGLLSGLQVGLSDGLGKKTEENSRKRAEDRREEGVSINRHAGEVALIGSSMGGFYAGCLSQRYGLRAALINPVVEPMALLHRVKGRQTHPFTGEVYSFSAADQQKFEQWGMLDPSGALGGRAPDADHMLLCLALKDEAVDPALAAARFQRSRRIIDPSGGHQFPRFSIALPDILAFLFPDASA